MPTVPPLPFPILSLVISYGLGCIILAMLVRAIASWFRVDERFAFIRFLARITDPFVEPCRRLIRPIGIIDVGFIITWFLIQTLQILLLQALPPGW